MLNILILLREVPYCTMEERTRDGKEILIYSIGKPEEVEEVAEFAAEYFYNASPLRELASFDDLTDEAGLFT